MRQILNILVKTICIIIIFQGAAAAFTISTLHDNFSMDTGTLNLLGSVEIFNTEKETVIVQIQYADWMYTTAGDSQYYTDVLDVPSDLTASVAKQSLRQYIDVFPTSVTLEPGEKMQVQYILRRPPVAGGYWGALMISAQVDSSQVSGAAGQRFNINVVKRYAYRVYLDVEPVTRILHFDAMKATTSDGVTTARALISNTGTTPCIVALEWTVLDVAGLNVQQAEYEGRTILPGYQREFIIEFPQLPATAKTVQVIASFGGAKLLGARTTIQPVM